LDRNSSTSTRLWALNAALPAETSRTDRCTLAAPACSPADPWRVLVSRRPVCTGVAVSRGFPGLPLDGSNVLAWSCQWIHPLRWVTSRGDELPVRGMLVWPCRPTGPPTARTCKPWRARRTLKAVGLDFRQASQWAYSAGATRLDRANPYVWVFIHVAQANQHNIVQIHQFLPCPIILTLDPVLWCPSSP
jgi:hypothetical protein